jgi:hypothetical protein
MDGLDFSLDGDNLIAFLGLYELQNPLPFFGLTFFV